MMEILRYLLIPQHDYRDPLLAARARVLMVLSSVVMLLAFVFGIFLLITLGTGNAITDRITTAAIGFIPSMLVVTMLAIWLSQNGRVQAAALLVGGALAVISVAAVLISGIDTLGVMVAPVLLAYMAIIYGARGTVLATLLMCFTVLLTALLQSQGLLALDEEPLEDLLYKAVFDWTLLALTAIMLWLFAWNLQRTLDRATRLANQTRTTAGAGQVISRILNVSELLPQTVDLIRDRFAFYHVQIFLVDETSAYANLAASTGTLGSALLAQGYRVPLGPRTVAGDAISSNEVRYVPELNETAYRRPELLNDSRTELALPLVVGEEVIGVLDIQSMRANAFADEDIEAMRIMATQVSQSIQNARLFESQQHSLLQNRRLFLESETNLAEIERLNRQLTGQSWREYIMERDTELGIQLEGDDVSTGAVDWSTAMRQAYERSRMVSQESGEDRVIAVPISIRGQSVGAIEVRLSGPHNQSEVRTIVQSVAGRMAFSLENARLFEQAQVNAERERQINQISAQLQGLTTVEDVMATAINALGETLGANVGTIRMVPQDAAEATDNTAAGNGSTPPPVEGDE